MASTPLYAWNVQVFQADNIILGDHYICGQGTTYGSHSWFRGPPAALTEHTELWRYFPNIMKTQFWTYFINIS